VLSAASICSTKQFLYPIHFFFCFLFFVFAPTVGTKDKILQMLHLWISATSLIYPQKCTEQMGCVSIFKNSVSSCIKVVSYAKNRILFCYGMMRTELSHVRTRLKEWTKRNPKKSAYSIWCRFVIAKLHGIGSTFGVSLLKDGRTRHTFLFQNVPDRPWGPPSLLFSRYRCFSHGGEGLSGWDMRLTTHLHLEPSEWSYISTFPICLLGVYSENFTATGGDVDG